MGAVAFVKTGWRQASRKQRVAIVAAVVVGLGGLSALGNAVSPTPSATPGATLSALTTPTASPTPAASATPTGAPTATPTSAPTATVEPTLEPTPSVEPTLDLAPTPEPTEVPPLAVTKSSLTSPVRRGSTATVAVKTAAGASCSIDVVYKSGSSTAAGLYPKTASSTGKVSWSWKVGTRTTAGTWPIYIDCSKGDQQGSLTLYFKVV
jgi:hypothetical protein